MKVGAHVSASGGAFKIFERGKKLGAECLQLFTRAPSQWNAPPLSQEMVDKFHHSRATSRRRQSVIAHDIYLNNLASEKDDIRRRSIETMVDELGRCFRLGIDGLVCHLGSHPESPETGLRRYSEAVAEILERTRSAPTPILLETCAGQGNCLGHRLEHLAEVIERNQHNPRLGVCVDTCHIFAAGYDLRDQERYQAFWNEFDSIIGLSRLRAFHLNDSKKPLNSRVDRHDHIGKGEIGETTFQMLLQDPRFEHLPGVIETPEYDKKAKTNLNKLKKLRRARG